MIVMVEAATGMISNSYVEIRFHLISLEELLEVDNFPLASPHGYDISGVQGNQADVDI